MTTYRMVWAYLFALGLTVSLDAAVVPWQQDDWCRDEEWGNDREGVCEVREYTVPAAGATLSVDASPNGGIKVDGTSRGDVLVRARVVATARTTEEARAIAARVQVTATADRVWADGPGSLGRREGWHVSYRLSVPTRTPLSLRTTNGGIGIDNVSSRVEFRTVNGGVKLSRMGGTSTGAPPTAVWTSSSMEAPGTVPVSTWKRRMAACASASRSATPHTSKQAP